MELDIRGSPITTIEVIVNNLRLTKLGLNLDFPEILSVKSITTLEVLFFSSTSDNKLEILKKQNPHLKIINDDLNIAWPDQSFNYKEGLWDTFEICEPVSSCNLANKGC